VPVYAGHAARAIALAVAMLALIGFRLMSRRLLAIALLPVAGLVSVLAQAKGFPYHFHPVTAGIALQALALVAWAWESARGKRRVVLALPLAGSLALAMHTATGLAASPHLQATWLVSFGATPEQRRTKRYFDGFPEADFFPWEMRQTADYLRDHTVATDRVQTYGMDPYVLFLAGRLSATPYVYAYDLNVDAALAGGSGGVPDAAQANAIRAMRDAHEKDLLGRLRRDPPAAFVFFDRAPLTTYASAEQDFEVHCPETAAWVHERYEEAASFGDDHVWLRRAR
jgi:hypothetical protein